MPTAQPDEHPATSATPSSQGPTQVLVMPSGYDLPTALICTYLVDVAASMGEAWIEAGSPSGWTDWTPNNLCSVTSGLFSIDQFSFGPLISSEFVWQNSQQWEPFGFVATQGNAAYLVFRGSQTNADFGMDGETALVPYTAPTLGGPANLNTEKGFTAVFTGLQGLDYSTSYDQLVITGHSLGSTLATLAVPAFLAGGASAANLVNYPQASPMVGDGAFVAYYNGLGVPTFRLVNSYDVVPTLPGANAGYAHVGVAATFGADYGTTNRLGFHRSVPDNHDPCCCYSYALINKVDPDKPNPDPYNSSIGTCMDWHPSK